MIEWDRCMEVQILHRQGKSLRAIVRQTGLSINTVRKYLRYGGRPVYQRRVTRPWKLDPYKEYLEGRVKEACPQWIPATVFAREITAQGYNGGLSQLRAYLRSLRPAVIEEPLVRFETEVGVQLQADWIEFRRARGRLSAFVATLGYSRASYVEFVSDEKLETLLLCHRHAFEFFAGVPREVLYDNIKTVVLERDGYGEGRHRFHPGFMDFAKHHGFLPRLCRPYRARTKGKVERFNHYLRYSFYVPLATRLKAVGLLLDKTTANLEVWRWLREVANVRVHATTGQAPHELLAEERAHLQPLPAPYRGELLPSACPPAEAASALNVPPSLNRLWPAPQAWQQHPLALYDKLVEGRA